MKRLLIVLCFLLAGQALAVEPDEILKDPVLEARARSLSAQLRCLVCQNQSIDDSEADLAKDLRLLIRDRLVKGETDQQVMDFIVSRYGDFVLLKPPLTPATLALWTSPFIVLMAGMTMLWRRRRKGVAALEQPLSGEEKAILSKSLD
jgi:cytochrome c-type biogenesis protein CcmH